MGMTQQRTEPAELQPPQFVRGQVLGALELVQPAQQIGIAGAPLEKLVTFNLLDQRAELSSGGEPLEDRLAERQLLSIREVSVTMASEAAFQQRFRPAEAETLPRRQVHHDTQHARVE